ncbi:MAG: hypothetical protein V1719_02405 [Patescibacteria group bacterium]
MLNMLLHKNLKQKGQTLVIMLMLMVVATFVGITVSTRFVKNLRLVSSADDSSKALSVAEALVERLLLVTSATLEEYISNNSCGDVCALSIADATSQTLTASAVLSFSGNSVNSYTVSLKQTNVQQVSLAGYQSSRTINVCWNGDASVVGSYIYTQSGAVKATPLAYNAVGTSHSDNGFNTSSSSMGYDNCFSVSAANTPQAIRLKTAYDDAEGAVIPEAGYSIPIQGIKIESTGRAGEAVRKVTVIKSKSFVPSYFDYVIYQKSTSEALSN